MMDNLISPAEKVVEKCICMPAVRRFNNGMNIRRNKENLKALRIRLHKVYVEIKGKLDSANMLPPSLIKPVVEWQQNVEAIEKKVEELVADIEQHWQCFSNCCPNCWNRFKNGNKVVDYLEEVKEYLESSEENMKDMADKLTQPFKDFTSLRDAVKKLTYVEGDVKNKVEQIKSKVLISERVQEWLDNIKQIHDELETIERNFDEVVSGNASYESWYKIGANVRERLEFANSLKAEGDTVALEVDKLIEPVKRAEKNMSSLREAMKELVTRKADVQSKIDSIINEFKEPWRHVEEWLVSVENVQKEISEIDAEFQKLSNSLSDLSMWCVIADKIDGKYSRVISLKIDSDSNIFQNVADPSRTSRVIEMQSSKLVIGQSEVVQEVKHLIDGKNISIIGIYGPGGVGKTTLLYTINNDVEWTKGFDIVIIVVVSQTVNIINVQTTIMSRLGLYQSGNEIENRQKIFKALSQKRFMILFDDIWKYLNLEEIGIPLIHIKKKNSKVIFTTRSEDLVEQMDAQKVRVKILEPPDAWLLFEESIGEYTLKLHDDIPDLAKQVAKECKGLPLALVVIGRAMKGKRLPGMWRSALTSLQHSKPEIEGTEKELYERLKLSYDNLASDDLRSCFLYCSSLPEDYLIRKVDLICYWMGEGFLEGSDSLEQVYDKGNGIIETLKLACLVESEEEYYKDGIKMHDVIRDMALWIVSETKMEKGTFLICTGESELPKDGEWKVAQRINLMDNQAVQEVGLTVECHNLRALLLHHSSLEMVTDDFFLFLPTLKVLNLSYTNIKKLPSAIGSLVELGYLNLFMTPLEELPLELGNLFKLKYLEVGNPEVNPVSLRNIITKLHQLRILHIWWNLESVEVDIDDLEYFPHLGEIGLCIATSSYFVKLARSSKLAKCASRLYMQDCDGGISSLQFQVDFKAMNRLEDLYICRCVSLKEIISSGNEQNNLTFHEHSILPKVEALSISHNYLLTELKLGLVHHKCFQNLSKLTVDNCTSLKTLACAGLAQTLKSLIVKNCDEMEELLSSEHAEQATAVEFKVLSKMELEMLPKLRSICVDGSCFFPSLEKLCVLGCSQLLNLPIDLIDGGVMNQIEGEQKWWDRLQWTDHAQRRLFHQYFAAY